MSKISREALKSLPNRMPSGIKFKEWQTGEENLPNASGYYFVKYTMIDSGKEYFSTAFFLYDNISPRTPDYDKWMILGGGECFARQSEDNIFNVTHWTVMESIY